MKRIVKSLAIATLFLVAPSSYADNAQMETMIKQLSNQLKVQMKSQMEVLSDPEMIKSQAKYLKALYDALIAAGFRKDQAMEIVIASVSGNKN